MARFTLFVLSILPITLSLWLGRLMGNILYLLSVKQRRTAYSQLKAAYSYKRSPKDLRGILRRSYQNLGMMLAEIAKFPKLDDSYVDKYIKIYGLDNPKEAIRKDRGVIFLTAHFGNWELSAQVAAIKGYPMKVLARQQKHSRLDNLLNCYRNSGKCKVIKRGFGIKDILRSLKYGDILGMLADQTVAKGDVVVDFLGRKIYIPTGPVAIGRKTKSAVLPSFIMRDKGPYHRLYIGKPLEYYEDKDSKLLSPQEVLQAFYDKLSNYIDNNPEQWLWIQRRKKSILCRSVLILSDGKAGHLNQAKAVAGLLEETLKEKGLAIRAPYAQEDGYKIVEVKYKNNLGPLILNLSSIFSTSTSCQGCLWCLRRVLEESCYDELVSSFADYIISCGSSVSGLNLILSRENNAKSIIIMKPPIRKGAFDLAIIPRHDNPKQTKNTLITNGAPSVFNDERLKEDRKSLEKVINLSKEIQIGLFFGGDSSFFKYQDSQLKSMLHQVKKAVETIDAELLVTTSRRTGSYFEDIFRDYLQGYARCKLLVLAGRKNLPYAVGGILALSKLIVVSFDSISMISEAVNSLKYVVVVVPEGYPSSVISKKHRNLIDNFKQKGYIEVATFLDLEDRIERLLQKKPPLKKLEDSQRIKEALKGLV